MMRGEPVTIINASGGSIPEFASSLLCHPQIPNVIRIEDSGAHGK
jgi:hypothetical protein